MKTIVLSAAICVMTASVACASTTPLATERLDISSYKVRIISAPRCDGTRYAYLIDTDGYLYRVEAGDVVGHDSGSILRINESSIEIMEVVKNSSGDWVDRKVIMNIEAIP